MRQRWGKRAASASLRDDKQHHLLRVVELQQPVSHARRGVGVEITH